MTKQKNSDQESKKGENSTLKISRNLRDIIHGYVMSDGYINKGGSLTVDHGPAQRKFVEWLYNELESLRTSTPIREVKRTHSKTKRVSRSYRFATRAVLKGFCHMWYEPVVNEKTGKVQYRKRLPKSIDCFFNETFITLWFAGDGTKILDALGAKYEVTSCTVEERLKLQSLFQKKFEIKTNIISSGHSKKKTEQKALKIPAAEYGKFRECITKMDLIPNLFPYKLHKKTSQ